MNMALHSFAFNEIVYVAIFYLAGAFVYAYRIPERWYPGSFDLVGHSHQWWHIAVFMGCAVHCFAILKMYFWWHSHNPTCDVVDAVMQSWYITGTLIKQS